MTTNQETTFDVEGMTCGSCVRHVNQALREVDGVLAVDVSLREGKVRVTHDAARAPIEAMVEALRDAGYASRPTAR